MTLNKMNNSIELKGEYNKNCIVYNSHIEDEELSLLYSILNKKEFKNSKIRIMPDHHLGKGILIGFTAPINDTICPSFVGVDIGCTITTCITNININENNISLIEHRIKKEIPMGFNIHKSRIFEMKDFLKFIRNEFNKAISTWPNMINDIIIDENNITNLLKKINMDEGVFYKSLGTLGGGNHFIEIGEYNGNYAFTVHCGSRNFGCKVCKYWEKLASSSQIDTKALKEDIQKLKNSISDKTQLPKLIKELTDSYKNKICSNGFLCGENMKGYLTDMVIAQAYAKYNHKLICEIIENIIKKIEKKGKIVEIIQSIHNYVDMQDHIIRKGAIRAYEGEKMIVPFNMRDGLAICVGKSNEEWNFSCSHGSGRKLSRSKAKEILSMEEFADSMKNVYSTSVCKNTIDEAPMAYKDTKTILDLIQQTADILYIVKPIINIKSTDEVKEY